MAGEMERFVRTTAKKLIDDTYPHVRLPAVVAALITTAQPLSDGWSEYSVQILEESGTPDSSYPEIPNVISRLSVEAGKTVAVALLYGMLSPVLIAEVQL